MTNSTGTAADRGVDPVDPAVVLAALASMVEDTEASIVRLQAVREAQLAVAQRFAEDLAAQSGPVRGGSADLSQRAVAAELAAVLHMSDRVVQGRMMRAADLMSKFPHTMQAFTEARINAAHVRLIQDTGTRLDDKVRAEFEQVAVQACIGETPHRAKQIIERVAERLAPRSLTERHQDAQKNRRVWREDLGDGQKALGLIHSAAIIDGIYDRLTQQARMIKSANTKAAKDAAAGLAPDQGGLGDPDDDRTTDQLRADLCADTLLTGAASGHDTPAGLLSAIQARVEVTIPAFTAMAPDTARTGATACGAPTGAGSAFGVRVEQPGGPAGAAAPFPPCSESGPSNPRNSPADNPSTPSPPGSSPVAPQRGNACSPTPSPGPSSPWTTTGPTPTCGGSCTHGIPGAGSRPVDFHPAPKTSTTPSTPPMAVQPTKATSAACVADIMC